MTDRLLTAREVADRLGVSTGALLRWTRAGLVPAVKLPSGAVRYERAQIDAWLLERTTGDATGGVSPTPNAARPVEVSSPASPTPLDTYSRPARTEEDHDAC